MTFEDDYERVYLLEDADDVPVASVDAFDLVDQDQMTSLTNAIRKAFPIQQMPPGAKNVFFTRSDPHIASLDMTDIVDDTMYDRSTVKVRSSDASPRDGWAVYSVPDMSESGFSHAVAVFVPRGISPHEAVGNVRDIPIGARRMSDDLWVSEIAAAVQVRALGIAKELHEV